MTHLDEGLAERNPPLLLQGLEHDSQATLRIVATQEAARRLEEGFPLKTPYMHGLSLRKPFVQVCMSNDVPRAPFFDYLTIFAQHL